MHGGPDGSRRNMHGCPVPNSHDDRLGACHAQAAMLILDQMLAPPTLAEPNQVSIETVATFLDAIGRAVPPQVFRRMFADFTPAGLAHAPSAIEPFGSRMTFVLDSCSLQRVLRSQLRRGKSGVLEGIRAGFLRPIAPRQLDREIRRGLRRIAADCGVPITAARALYREVAALIEFKPVSPAQVRRLKRELPNPEDAAFVALLFETEALGIVTEDKAYRCIPGMRAYSTAETGRIVLCYRKQATVLVCSISMARITWDFMSRVVGGVARLVRAHPRVAVGIALVTLALAARHPDKALKIVEGCRSASAAYWALLGPYIVAFVSVAQDRVCEAADLTHYLKVGPTANAWSR